MQKINGWINLYKQPGLTSTATLNSLKRLLGKVKIGHAGTLDPLAFGILPVALGEATKTIPYMVDATKTYQFKAMWGEERDSDDGSGALLQSSQHRPTIAEINERLPQFQGTYLQQPPHYSAKKIQGQRACDLMRAGEIVNLAPSQVTIYSLKIIQHFNDDETLFEMTCGKGTYVRAVVRDLGRKLGCWAYADAIHRTQVGKFTTNNAIMLEKLAVMEKTSIVDQIIMPLEVGLDDIPAALLTWQQVDRLKSGQGVVYEKDDVVVHGLLKQTYVCLNPDQKAVAIALLKDHVLYPSRVFNI